MVKLQICVWVKLMSNQIELQGFVYDIWPSNHIFLVQELKLPPHVNGQFRAQHSIPIRLYLSVQNVID